MSDSDIAFANFMRRMERMRPEELLRESTYTSIDLRPAAWPPTPPINSPERAKYERDNTQHRW